MKKGIFVVLMILILAAGCSVLPGLSSGDQPIEFTDSTGHLVTLAGIPERVVIAGKATIMVQDAIYLFNEADQKVIALENRNHSACIFASY